MWRMWVCGGCGYVADEGMWRQWACGGWGYVEEEGMGRSEEEGGFEQVGLDCERVPALRSGVMLVVLEGQWEAHTQAAKRLAAAVAPLISDDI